MSFVRWYINCHKKKLSTSVSSTIGVKSSFNLMSTDISLTFSLSCEWFCYLWCFIAVLLTFVCLVAIVTYPFHLYSSLQLICSPTTFPKLLLILVTPLQVTMQACAFALSLHHCNLLALVSSSHCCYCPYYYVKVCISSFYSYLLG